MGLFATDRNRLAFLLETDAALDLDFEALKAQAEAAAEEPSPEQWPKYITSYIGSKQKLVDWIWKHTPEGVESAADAFSGSAVVAYMYKTKGLRVLANDRLRYCRHAPWAIIENDKVRLFDEEIKTLFADNARADTFVLDHIEIIFFAQGVHDLTVVELQEMAKAKGVSLNMTKQDVIDLLDEVEPGVDHKALQGATLIDAKKKHHTCLPRKL